VTVAAEETDKCNGEGGATRMARRSSPGGDVQDERDRFHRFESARGQEGEE